MSCFINSCVYYLSRELGTYHCFTARENSHEKSSMLKVQRRMFERKLSLQQRHSKYLSVKTENFKNTEHGKIPTKVIEEFSFFFRFFSLFFVLYSLFSFFPLFVSWGPWSLKDNRFRNLPVFYLGTWYYLAWYLYLRVSSLIFLPHQYDSCTTFFSYRSICRHYLCHICPSYVCNLDSLSLSLYVHPLNLLTAPKSWKFDKT